MKQGIGFIYQAEGHTYLLQPEYTVSLHRIWLVGAGISTVSGKYLGYWDRHNMPTTLIADLNRWVKTWHADQIAQRRNAMLRKERKPRYQ